MTQSISYNSNGPRPADFSRAKGTVRSTMRTISMINGIVALALLGTSMAEKPTEGSTQTDKAERPESSAFDKLGRVATTDNRQILRQFSAD